MVTTIQNFGKGGLIKPVSLKDYRLEAVPCSVDIPKNFEIVFGGKIKNQNGSGSCVSQAVSYYAEVLNYKETGEWVELSPKFLYSQCFLSPWGSYTKDNMDLVKNRGISPESLTPSYEQGNPPSEAFMQNKADITPESFEKALTYITKDYYTWDNTNIDIYKRAIYQGQGCVVISWGNNYCWQNSPILMPTDKSQLDWRHGIYLIGYNDDLKMFKFLNSWGTGWGEAGYGYLPYDYVMLGYVSNPMTMIDANNNTYDLLKKLIGLYQNVITLLKGNQPKVDTLNNLIK